jgi:hypothetical protein
VDGGIVSPMRRANSEERSSVIRCALSLSDTDLLRSLSVVITLIGVWGICRRLDDGSRMSREIHARFCERPGVKFPGHTHPYVKIRPVGVLVPGFRLSTRRGVAAAKAFFRKAVKSEGSTPTTITLDGHAVSHRAVRELKAAGQLVPIRTCGHRSTEQLIEQDHRGVKLCIGQCSA